MKLTLVMEYASTTTLNAVRAKSPCESGWAKLLKTLGKTAADDEPLSLLTVLDSNELGDALWVLSYAMPDDRLARHFKAWCAEQVLHLFEAKCPDDKRVRDQIAMLRNDDATTEDRDAARAAAMDAAWDATSTAAWDAAAEAARGAATLDADDAALDAASTAALGAASTFVWDATMDAAWLDARDAAGNAARHAAMVAQERQLRIMLGAT